MLLRSVFCQIHELFSFHMYCSKIQVTPRFVCPQARHTLSLSDLYFFFLWVCFEYRPTHHHVSVPTTPIIQVQYAEKKGKEQGNENVLLAPKKKEKEKETHLLAYSTITSLPPSSVSNSQHITKGPCSNSSSIPARYPNINSTLLSGRDSPPLLVNVALGERISWTFFGGRGRAV